MRRTDYLFLAMIAFAAAMASAPTPPRIPMLGEPTTWVMSDSALPQAADDRPALRELDFSGNPISPEP